MLKMLACDGLSLMCVCVRERELSRDISTNNTTPHIPECVRRNEERLRFRMH